MRRRPTNAVGQQLDEAWLVVPAVDEDELGTTRDRGFELLAVAADREARPVGREDEPDDRLRALLDRRVRSLDDPRVPVLHAGEDGEAELPLEGGPGLLGDR